MASFNINTFSPVYPQSDDKRGEVQIIKIGTPNLVDDVWTPQMRLDYLPVFQNQESGVLSLLPVGRQTMYRNVVIDTELLPWSTQDPSTADSFLLLSTGTGGFETESFLNFIENNVKGYQATLNYWLAQQGNTESIIITEVHVISSNIQFGESITNHSYFQTYDCIFYGQQSPNPAIPAPTPPPACDTYSGYIFSVNRTISPLAGLMSVEPSAQTIASVELYSIDGGGTARVNSPGEFKIYPTPATLGLLNAGDYYTIKVSYTPLATGTTIEMRLIVQGIVLGTYILNDTGTAFYVPVQYQNILNYSLEFTFAKSQPTATPNNPTITFELATSGCSNT